MTLDTTSVPDGVVFDEQKMVYAIPNTPPKSKRTHAAHHERKTRKDEEKRIERAMEQLEQAKRDAEKQRQDYAQYLKWKVKMQHKEQAQREKEEMIQREQAERHLQDILQDHRIKKQQAAKSYYEPRNPQKILPRPARKTSDPPLSTEEWAAMMIAEKRGLQQEGGDSFKVDHADAEENDTQGNAESRSERPKRQKSESWLRKNITFEDILKLPLMGGPSSSPRSPRSARALGMGLNKHGVEGIGKEQRTQSSAAPKTAKDRAGMVEFMYEKIQPRRDASQKVAAQPRTPTPNRTFSRQSETHKTRLSRPESHKKQSKSTSLPQAAPQSPRVDTHSAFFVTEPQPEMQKDGLDAKMSNSMYHMAKQPQGRKPQIGRRGRYFQNHPLLGDPDVKKDMEATMQSNTSRGGQDEPLSEAEQGQMQKQRMQEYAHMEAYIQKLQTYALKRGMSLNDFIIGGNLG
mmetsp:Transcript_21059/g.33414  ORF Transcript_21059/g.33414 Transcript_21059/m.33414 type:complete len:460 (-) Transcript_21059:441-1820(-)